MCGTILTEHLLSAGRRPETSQQANLGRTKEKWEKGIGMGPGPLGGSCERGQVLAPWKVPSVAETPARTRWGALVSWRRTQQVGYRGQSRQWPAHMGRATVWDCPSWDAPPLGWMGADCWGLDSRGQTWGERWGWLQGNSLRELECDAP